jgi:hypothetical protein
VFKGEGRDLGGAHSGKAGEDHGGRCAAGAARRKKGRRKTGRRQVGSAGQREGGRERECAEEAAVRARPSWAARGKEEKENRAGAEWAGAREERWATGKEAGLGWELGLPSYFLPFFFSNHPKSI